MAYALRLFLALWALTLSGVFVATADVVGDFSRLDDTWGVAISPDGNTLALGCVYQGKKAICVAPIDGDIEPTVYPGSDELQIINFYWASNSHVIMITDSTELVEFASGLRRTRINRALSFNVRTGKTAVLLKDFRGFTNTTNVVSLLEEREDKVMMAMITYRDANDAGFSKARRLQTGWEYFPFIVDLDSGRGRQQNTRGTNVVDVIYDNNGDPIVRTLFDEDSTDFEIQNHERRTIHENNDAPIQPFSVLGLTSDGEGVLVWSDGVSVSGYDRGIWRMALSDGAMSRVSVGDFEVRDHPPIIDQHTGRAVGFSYSDDLSGQYLTDPEFSKAQRVLENSLPGYRIQIGSWSRDRRRLVVRAEKSGRPIEYYLAALADGELTLIGASNEAAAARELGEVLSVSYQAKDGMEIPAYLTLPEGKQKADGPFPTILLPHGGPDASDNASYDWWAQAYAAAGYAVLQPNFRGSNRYGAAFREAGFGEFGGKMVTDVLDGLDWMEAQGLAQPGGACVVGASYGGYSALMAPLLDASRVKCSVSVNGVTDPIAQMGQHRQSGGGNASIISYWEQYMGGLFANEAQHASITPASRINEYRRPVLLIHGDEDTRVDFGQYEGFVKKAGDASWLTKHVMRGQNHFLGTSQAREEVLQHSLSFLATHHPAN